MTAKDIFEFAKVAAEVGLAVVGYATIQLNPMLQREALGFAIVGMVLAAIWVMGSSRAQFNTKGVFIRKPLIPLMVAFLFYGALQFAINYFDVNPPTKPSSTLADLLIGLLYAATFSLLTISFCSLLRAIGIDLRG